MNKRYIKLLLCIFGSTLGLHYWYTKKYKKAILFFITFGGFGFWHIYDIVKLIIDKDYLEDTIDNKPKEIKDLSHYNNVKDNQNTNEKIETKKEVISTQNKRDIKCENKIETKVKLNIKENNDFEDAVKKNKELKDRVDDILNRNLLKNTDLYLASFNNIEKYDLNKNLDEEFLKKLKRVRDVDYERFVKPSGTTDRPMDFVVFDLETTGLNQTSNEIIEIGAIRFETNKPVEYFHTFIKPKRKITARITSINGITNEMVENCPTIEEVMPKFLDFIKDDVLIAHNSDFDMGFVLNKLYDLGYKKPKNKVIDTLKLSRQKIREYDYEKDRNKKLSSYKLEDLKYEFGLWGVRSHNAIDDCKVCAFVYMKIAKEYGDFCYID